MITISNRVLTLQTCLQTRKQKLFKKNVLLKTLLRQSNKNDQLQYISVSPLRCRWMAFLSKLRKLLVLNMLKNRVMK